MDSTIRTTTLQEYLHTANLVARKVAAQHKGKITACRKGAGKYLSFGVHPTEAYCHPKGPLTLRAICHPANLLISRRKHNASIITTKRLRERITVFENRHGHAVYPEGHPHDFKKTLSTSRTQIVLGLDPGPKNFGVYVGKQTIVNGVIRNMRCLHSSMLAFPLEHIKSDINSSFRSMLGEIQSYHEQYEPDVLVIERFQARGFKGVIVELVNIMIGAIVAQAHDAHTRKEVHIVTPTPAIWKNQVNRVTSLDDIYKEVKTTTGPHRLDAALLSVYPANTDINPYLPLADESFRTKFLKTLNCKS